MRGGFREQLGDKEVSLGWAHFKSKELASISVIYDHINAA